MTKTVGPWYLDVAATSWNSGNAMLLHALLTSYLRGGLTSGRNRGVRRPDFLALVEWSTPHVLGTPQGFLERIIDSDISFTSSPSS